MVSWYSLSGELTEKRYHKVVISVSNLITWVVRSAPFHGEFRDLSTNFSFRLARFVVELLLHNCCSTPVDVFVELLPRFVRCNSSTAVCSNSFCNEFWSLGTELLFFLPFSVGNSTVVSGESNSSQNSALSFDTETDLVPSSSPSSFTWIGQTSRRFQLDSHGTSSLKFDALVSLPGVYNMNNLRVLARISDDHEPGGAMNLQKPCPPSYIVVENTFTNS